MKITSKKKTKKCTKCGETKKVSEYYQSKSLKSSSYGHYYPHCKECDKIKARKWYASDKERINKYRKTWKRNNPEKAAASRKKDKTIHKDKHDTRAITRQAIKTNRLVKPSKCQICLKKKPLETHHKDYSDAFNVIFICKQCHIELHRRY